MLAFVGAASAGQIANRQIEVAQHLQQFQLLLALRFGKFFARQVVVER